MSEKAEEHFVGKIAQKVIVENGDGAVLLMRDPREINSIWELPGGRMNVDEDPYTAIMREFFEELGVEIIIHEVVHMEQFIQGNEGARSFVIVYRASLKHPDSEFSLAPEEVAEVGWFRAHEVKNLPLFPEYKKALDKYFALQT